MLKWWREKGGIQFSQQKIRNPLATPRSLWNGCEHYCVWQKSWKPEEAICAAFSPSRPDIKDTKWKDCYLQHKFTKAQQIQALVHTSRMETVSPVSFQGSSKWGLWKERRNRAGSLRWCTERWKHLTVILRSTYQNYNKFKKNSNRARNGREDASPAVNKHELTFRVLKVAFRWDLWEHLELRGLRLPRRR